MGLAVGNNDVYRLNKWFDGVTGAKVNSYVWCKPEKWALRVNDSQSELSPYLSQFAVAQGLTCGQRK
jgi:hypothetical protein